MIFTTVRSEEGSSQADMRNVGLKVTRDLLVGNGLLLKDSQSISTTGSIHHDSGKLVLPKAGQFPLRALMHQILSLSSGKVKSDENY